MGNWFTSPSPPPEDVSSDAEYLESLEKFALSHLGQHVQTEQDCVYFGGKYTPPKYTSGSEKTDSQTGLTSLSFGRCQMPSLSAEHRRILLQGLCSRKLNPDVFYCSPSVKWEQKIA
jgi:hypothetical protein